MSLVASAIVAVVGPFSSLVASATVVGPCLIVVTTAITAAAVPVRIWLLTLPSVPVHRHKGGV